MNNLSKSMFLSAALAILALPVVAQSTDAPAPAATPAPVTSQEIQGRKDRQQDRIANGVKSGELTAGETTNLENKEADINHEEKDMRKLDDGHLTAADKATLNQQQNQVSKDIYADKHNADVQNKDPHSEYGARAERQQGRIAQGVQSGQLTSGEAAHLEGSEAKINQEVRSDRAANGGKLTSQERAQVNQQQNKVSKQIYKDKHNDRTRTK